MKRTILGIVILCSFCFFSCKKEKQESPVDTGNANAFNSNTEEYIKFNLGGTNYNLTPPSMGTWSFSSGSGSIISGVYSVSKTFVPAPGFYLDIADTTSNTTTVSDVWFRNFLTTKNYTYKPNQSNNRGIWFSTKDNSNVNWYTAYSSNPAYQNTSTFTIVDKIEYTQNGDLYIKFKATFSCKMYNTNGDSLMLTNGEMITDFHN